MDSNLTTIAQGVLSFAATYWLHSTALIGAVYCLLRLRTQSSHALKERLWKFSAVAGLFTAGLQTVTGFGVPILPAKESPVSESRVLASASVIQEPQVVDASTALPATATIDESLLLVRESLARLQNSTSAIQETVKDDSEVASNVADSPSESTETLSAVAGHVDEVSEKSAPYLVSETLPLVGSDARPASSAAVDSPSRGIVVVWWVGLTLAAVTAIGFLLFVGQWLVFLVDTRGIVSATDRQLQILRRLQRRLGVTQRIDLRVSHRLSEPVAYGVLQWKIVLPDRLEERLTPDELDSLLAHEIAHLVRGDIMWMHVGRFLATALAWQPLNFLVRARWQAEAEFQCDDWAIRRSIDPVALARCLTAVAQWRSDRCSGVVALPIGGQRSHITERVERLLALTDADRLPRRAANLLLTASMCLAAGTLAVGGPSIRPAQPVVRDVGVSLEDDSINVYNAAVQKVSDDSGLRKETDLSENSRAVVLTELDHAAAELALEVALLAEELRTLEPLLDSAKGDAQIESAVRRLKARIAELSGVTAKDVQTEKTTGKSR